MNNATKPNDGGPAFPLLTKEMSLRRWFAGQAMMGLLADPNCQDSCDAVAITAYALAECMLKARGEI